MAYRLLREFRQASTRLDTPPVSIRHHPGSAIAPTGVQVTPVAATSAKLLAMFKAKSVELDVIDTGDG